MSLIKLTSARLSISSIRLYSQNRSSKLIRQQFLDFFLNDNQHHFVKSSSVIPFCDPSLSFCNAGMNQFKNILLGNQKAKHKRVANSQKCIRVGGKHNDLSVVGSDSYHHTFFEMLGNWSFGDYFKKEACEMAWKLLTEVYKIPPERLYVTFFKGDDRLGLSPDLECKDIWRQIGVAENRIVGFGTKENFWEMGTSGPCGGCTEIHVDHLPSFQTFNRSHDVNQDKSDLTELWNIVFIEHFRHTNGSIEKLPERHVDTGMGFERLVAFLQNKTSNYDSDLFTPIFEAIEKATEAPKYSGSFEKGACKLDTAYRIISDHSRMVAISLADGMFPETNSKLRRVLRKCIKVSEKDFNQDNLLHVTVPIVSEILGETFPELKQRMNQVLDIIKDEQDLFKVLRSKMSKDVEEIVRQNPKLSAIEMFDYAAFVEGYQEFIKHRKSKIVSGNDLYYIHSSFGFDLELLERLSEIERIPIDSAGFAAKMSQVKKAFNDQHFDTLTSIDGSLNKATENDFKYDYTFDGVHKTYKVKPLMSKILSIVNQTKNCANSNNLARPVKLILEKSPFYFESGGQESDDGFIIKGGKKFKLKSLASRRNCVLHEIELQDEPLQVGDEVQLEVDHEKRSSLTRNHSATHLLNSAMRKLLRSPIYQKSSLVSSDSLKIELACFGPKITRQDLEKVEDLIRLHIKNQPLERKIRILNSQDLQEENDVVMVPGEFYPDDGIRLVTFGDFSKELCCGTHVFNTSELEEFTFLSMRGTGRISYLFTATTGKTAVEALRLGDELVSELEQLNHNISIKNFKEVLDKLRDISIKLNNSNLPIALLKKIECQKLTAEIKEKCKLEIKSSESEEGNEMRSVLERRSSDKFIIHFLSCSEKIKSVSLPEATKLVQDRPVLVFSFKDSTVKAQCCVPPSFVSETFNAESWLHEVARVFETEVSTPKGQNPKELSNMKKRKVQNIEKLLKDSISAAKTFAKANMA